MAQDYRVALIAIASNEGAYLAQFVFHHLRMGFAPIILITNNSEDDTAAMAARMAERLPDVHHLDGDPIRAIKPLLHFQVRAYRHGVEYLRSLKLKPNYVMFLDIDEYWVPLDGSRSVEQFIKNHNAPDLLMFNWVAPNGDNLPFSHPFIPNFRCVTLPPIKTIWRYGVEMKQIHVHNSQSDEFRTEYIASGVELAETRGRTVARPEHPGNAVVIHQLFRSMAEYVAMLERGRPRDNLPFKSSTRDGFRSYLRRFQKIDLNIDQKFCVHWVDEFPAWLDSFGGRQILISGRINVLHRASRALDKYCAMTDIEREPFALAFEFVDFDAVRAEIAELLADPDGRIARIP